MEKRHENFPPHSIMHVFFALCLSLCDLYSSDIDECALRTDNCDANAECTDTFGSFSCACNPGFEGDGAVNCASMRVLFTVCLSLCDLYSSDIDECALRTDNCDANAECTDTDGSFNCTCNPGFEGDGVNCESKPLHNLICDTYYFLTALHSTII